jgi:hypothetical protein
VESQLSERRIRAVQDRRLLAAPTEDDTEFDPDDEAGDDGYPPQSASRPRRNIAQSD